MTGIVRAPRAGQFEVVPHALIRDPSFSFRALGVLTRLLSNADGYKMTSNDLARERGEGRNAIRTALRELEAAGYLRRHRWQDERGRWLTEVTVFDTPFTEDGFPGIGKSTPGNPATGAPIDGKSGVKSSSTKRKTSTTTKLLPGAQGESPRQERQVVVVELIEGLTMPPQLTPEQLASAERILVEGACPASLQQDVLDEMQGVVERGEVKSSPLRLLRGLAKAAAAGTFVPDLGIQIKTRRRRKAEEAANRGERDQQHPCHPVDTWATCRELLRAEFLDEELNTWIDPLQVVRCGDRIVLLAPNAFVIERVHERYLPRIRDLLELHAGCSDVSLEVGSALGNASKRAAA